MFLNVTGDDGDCKTAFRRRCGAEQALEFVLLQLGHSFVQDERFGFLTAFPEKVGTCLSLFVTLWAPNLATCKDLSEYCKSQGLTF